MIEVVNRFTENKFLLKILLLNTIVFCFGSNLRSTEISEESCLWVDTLNYRYPNTAPYFEVDDNDRWHTNRTELLKVTAKAVPGVNIAVARVNIIYQTLSATDFQIYSYDLPSYFLSGWDNKRLGFNEKRSTQALKTLGTRFAPELNVNYSDLIFVGSSFAYVENGRVEYVNHLLSIYNNQDLRQPFSKENNSSLERIKSKPAELINYKKVLIKKDSKLKTDEEEIRNDFQSRFYDSEQGLFLKLQQAIYYNHFIQNIPEGSIIHKSVVNIASYTDICFDCGDTAFRQSEARRSFDHSLYKYFKNNPKNYTIKDNFSTFFTLSSLKPTRHGNWESRGQLTNYRNAYYEDSELLLDNNLLHNNFLNIESFKHYVAQKCLEHRKDI
jgi:hypothetical protein